MSISAIGTNSAITAAAEVKRKQASLWSQGSSATGAPAQDTFTSDFASILSSVQAGDITGAQAALTKLTGDQPPADTSYSPWSTSSASGASSTGASSSTGSSPSSDVQSLLQAVQGGDIGAAQQALSSLQTDMANVQSTSPDAASSAGAATQKAGHHHHHHHHAEASTSSTGSTDGSSTDPTSTDSTAAAADAFGVSA